MSKDEIKDEVGGNNIENNELQDSEEIFEDEDGPMVRSYSEGALKKFKTLPNKS